MKTQSRPTLETSTELFLELVELSAELSTVLAREGIVVDCSPLTVRGAFDLLEVEEQATYVDRFRFFVSVIASAPQADPLAEQRYTWHVLKMLKVRPPSDLFQFVEPGDYIEIYDQSGIQVFRNFGFCRIVTYTFHELLMYPWTSLYERDAAVTEKIHGAIGRVMGSTKTIHDLGIEKHLCREKTSTKVYEVEMKYFAPLFNDQNQAQFFIAGSSIKRVDVDA